MDKSFGEELGLAIDVLRESREINSKNDVIFASKSRNPVRNTKTQSGIPGNTEVQLQIIRIAATLPDWRSPPAQTEN